jgi:hypothetical protein
MRPVTSRRSILRLVVLFVVWRRPRGGAGRFESLAQLAPERAKVDAALLGRAPFLARDGPARLRRAAGAAARGSPRRRARSPAAGRVMPDTGRGLVAYQHASPPALAGTVRSERARPARRTGQVRVYRRSAQFDPWRRLRRSTRTPPCEGNPARAWPWRVHEVDTDHPDLASSIVGQE